MDSKFEIFWTIINGRMDFSGEHETETKKFMLKSLKDAGYASITDAHPIVQTLTAKGGKRLSGWNIYMKDRMTALKDQIKSGSERLKTIGTEWKALSKEQQAEWNAKAKGVINAPPVIEKPVPAPAHVHVEPIAPVPAPVRKEPITPVPVPAPAPVHKEPVAVPVIEKPLKPKAQFVTKVQAPSKPKLPVIPQDEDDDDDTDVDEDLYDDGDGYEISDDDE